MSDISLFQIPKPNAAAKVKLFCFPFAGGSSTIYFPWLKLFPNDVELVFVQLPGRQNRISDEPYRDMKLLVKDMTSEIISLIDRPYIFFGYSLGGKIAYELSLSLKKIGIPLPVQFVVAACPAPHLARRIPDIHHLPDNEFIQKLVNYNGTPSELFTDQDFIDLVLPCLRADFELLESYSISSVEILQTKLILYGGDQDDQVSLAELLAWKELFSDLAEQFVFRGGHFFIYNAIELIALKLNSSLESNCNLKISSSVMI